MGDFGTLLPLAVGYIVVCGLDPAGLLIMIGVANIVAGLVFKLPMPVEPMKVIAVVAIAQQWSPSMVYASGFAMGIIWLVFAATGVIKWIEKVTPQSVIHGIQATLGLLLAIEAVKMISTGWAIGVASLIIVLLFRTSRYAPAAIVLMLMGIVLVFVRGEFRHIAPPSFAIPSFASFSLHEIWQVLLLAGLAQIPLTITNATLATSSLIKNYWPQRQIDSKQLAWSQGLMNTILPFFNSMPLCHGAGGLASQYYYGARTGGANIMEGLMEICLGLFFSVTIVGLFTHFPMAIIGGMMFLVGIELTRFAWSARFDLELIPMLSTVLVAMLTNMAFGFLTGLAVHHGMRLFSSRMK